MKFKYILSLLLLINYLTANSQVAVDYLITILEKADSVMISTIHYDEAAIMLPLPGGEGKLDRKIYTLSSSVLSTQEVKTFAQKLNKITKGGVASPHYDIELNVYLRDSIYTSIRISSYMQSIFILNEKIECDDSDDFWGTKCYYQGDMSKSQQKYVTALLRKKGLWGNQESFYEW